MNILQCSFLSLFIFSSFYPCATFLIPTLGLVRAQEAPQQISSGLSCAPDIKGVRREGGKQQRNRDTGQQTHWHQYGSGEGRTWSKAEQRDVEAEGPQKWQDSWNWETHLLWTPTPRNHTPRWPVNNTACFAHLWNRITNACEGTRASVREFSFLMHRTVDPHAFLAHSPLKPYLALSVTSRQTKGAKVLWSSFVFAHLIHF